MTPDPAHQTVRDLPGGLTVTVDHDAETITTRFPDGLEIRATARFTTEDVARARALGYRHRSDVEATWAMHADHDLLHHVVAIAEGWPYSMVLRAVATGQGHPPGFGAREERLAFLVAAALNADRIEAIVP